MHRSDHGDPAAGVTFAGSRAALFLVIVSSMQLLLSGCGINPRIDLATMSRTADPLVLQSVPFFPQSDYQCGPAALSTVLVHSGIDITPEQLTPQVYLPERKGSLQIELLAATRRAGRIPYILPSEPQALIDELSGGRPVVVFQNLRTRSFPVWHYAVLKGFDPVKNEFILNSGTQQDLRLRASRFLRTWDWSGRWAMIALKPGQLPEKPDPFAYFQAVSDFELVASPDDLSIAWQAGANQWPEDYRPHLALGNLAYKAGKFDLASQHYLDGLKTRPGEAVLENNLAESVAAAGCPRTAQERLSRFFMQLEKSSPWHENIRNTLDEIRNRAEKDRDDCTKFGVD